MDPYVPYRILAKFITAYMMVKYGILVILYFITHPFAELYKVRSKPPECINDPKHGEHKYAHVNGIKIHYVEKGDHNKPLMLFLHGFPEFWYSWRHQIAEFSKDYWCVAIDMRGYADSDKPPNMGAYSINNIIQDIKEMIDYLGCTKVTLVGHDWGALLVWSFVSQHSELVESYVAISGPQKDVYLRTAVSEWWQFQHSWYVFYFQCLWLPEVTLKLNDFVMYDLAMKKNKFVTEDDIEAYKYIISQPGACTPPLNYYRENFLKYQEENKLENRPPGLYILGELDEYISQSTLENHKKYFDRVQTAVIKGARHFIQQEEPEEINRLMREFFKTEKILN